MMSREKYDILLLELERERDAWSQQNQDDEWFQQLDEDANAVREFLGETDGT